MSKSARPAGLLPVHIIWLLGAISLASQAALAAEDAAPKSPAAATKPAAATVAASVDHAIVPTFERFFAATDKEHPEHSPAAGGRLLLGELSCTRCHQVDAQLEPHFVTKTGPNLSQVAERVRPAWLKKYLTDPHEVKPGNTMPDVLAHLPAADKAEQAEALTHFLVSLAPRPPVDQIPDRAAATRGQKLLNEVGCLACHDEPDVRQRRATSVPWGNLAEKYSSGSLAKFLADPHQARPSGRMPKLGLSIQEATDVSHYFLREVQGSANLKYDAYRNKFQSIDEISQKQPKESGECLGFNLDVAERENDIGIRFTGYLRLLEKAEYTFYLTSDDGSRLTIDGVRVVDNDGIHSKQTKDGNMILDRGPHQVVVEYFNASGEGVLELEFESPKLPKGDIVGALSLTADGEPPQLDAEKFRLNADLVMRGRSLFQSQGCANCHDAKEDDKSIATMLKVAPLTAKNASLGCLADKPSGSAPRYKLSTVQRAALQAALTSPPPAGKKDSPQLTIARSMMAFNCYACHARGGVGGVEPSRDDLFLTTIKEMGDEGRLPPALNGVGFKLTHDWLERVLKEGTVLINKQKTRPYMRTRMPAFGEGNVKPLVGTFEKADAQVGPAAPALDEPDYLTKDNGRLLAGSRGFSCIKCHTFGKYQAEGIQSIDMTMMTRRLRREWFVQYVRDPAAYRPGTRMPNAWPKQGKSMLPTLYAADCEKQIAALWIYLLDGDKGRPPQGVGGQPIELIPKDEPIVYRNFIEGAGARAIAVGYPEKLNLAFDSANLRMALIWQGAFIDASRHWSGRSEGFQPPLGDRVIPLPDGVPLAALKDAQAPWPTTLARETDGRFVGYWLDEQRRPMFMYRIAGVHVEDFPEPVVSETSKEFRRTLKLLADKPTENLWFRAVAANSIAPLADGWYRIDNNWKLRIESSGPTPVVRAAGKKHELIVPVGFRDRESRIVQTYQW